MKTSTRFLDTYYCWSSLYNSGGTYSLRTTDFWETFHGNFICSEFLPEISEDILFVFCFRCLAWGSNPGFTSNKPTHYLLDYGDFMIWLDYNDGIK